MSGKSQHLRLSPEENEKLRHIEQSEHFRAKVRLRAQVIRLNAVGWSREQLAAHTGRSYATVCQDLKRWRERGLAGLADAPATNQPEKLSHEMRIFVHEKLQEERTWTCSQLVEAIKERFGVEVSAEAMRKRVKDLGYCWKRTRYVPCKAVDPEVEREHRASLDMLKRGLVRDA